MCYTNKSGIFTPYLSSTTLKNVLKHTLKATKHCVIASYTIKKRNLKNTKQFPVGNNNKQQQLLTVSSKYSIISSKNMSFIQKKKS